MNKGYYIDTDNQIVYLENRKKTFLWENNIKEMYLPNRTESFFCTNSSITKLVLSKRIKNICCNRNKITEIDIPNGVKSIKCMHNNIIEKLKLPDSIEIVFCDIDAIEDLYKYINNNNISFRLYTK